MKKRGVFFTFTAIFMVILIVAVMTTRDKYRYREKSNAIASRVKTMNNFIDDLEKDIGRELFIGGYRAILSMNAYVRINEDFITNFDAVFTEIFINGSINGTTMELMKQDSQGADLNSWLVRVNEEASELNIKVEMSNSQITVKQISPWIILVTLTSDVNITDLKGIATWSFNREYDREFSIIGFEDPLYTVGTSDKVTSLVNITPDMDFVDDNNDTTILNAHLINSYYTNSTSAPSFLMRFAGNLSPSLYGIESMVNLEDLDAQNLPLLSRSVIDYIYFHNQSTNDKCNVTDMPSWFRIDDAHLDIYEVSRLEYQGC